MADIRLLAATDAAALDAFLAAHADSSVFLRSNARHGGLEYRGQRGQGSYVAMVDGGDVVAVAALAWNGNLLVQAPVHLDDVVRACVRLAGRDVCGVLGPWAQVEAALAALDLADTPARMRSRENLFALSLADLVVPPALASGEVTCRPPRDDELDVLGGWRGDYAVETLSEPDTPETRAAARVGVEVWHREGDLFALEHEGRLVSMSGFNARLPDLVQVGGVWTPHALRGRGYGRAVVAGSLVAARAQGITRSVLFTDVANVANRVYESIGYRIVGDYGLVLF